MGGSGLPRQHHGDTNPTSRYQRPGHGFCSVPVKLLYSDVVEQRYEAEVHVQLLVAMEHLRWKDQR